MKIAVLADIHSNFYALDAVYSDLKRESVEKIIVAGDLVGYYYWPKQVISTLMNDNRVITIAGNHENILREVIASREQDEFYFRKYGSGYRSCVAELSQEEVDWLLALPTNRDIVIDGVSFHIGHGSLRSPDDYVYPSAPSELIANNYSSQDFTIFGHTHYPLLHASEGKCLLNPGSVGQPRDLGGLASYAIINLTNGVVQFKRTPFDATKVARVARARDPGNKYLWEIMARGGLSESSD